MMMVDDAAEVRPGKLIFVLYGPNGPGSNDEPEGAPSAAGPPEAPAPLEEPARGGAAPAGGPPCWVPVTWKAFETCTWTSPPDFVMTRSKWLVGPWPEAEALWHEPAPEPPPAVDP